MRFGWSGEGGGHGLERHDGGPVVFLQRGCSLQTERGRADGAKVRIDERAMGCEFLHPAGSRAGCGPISSEGSSGVHDLPRACADIAWARSWKVLP